METTRELLIYPRSAHLIVCGKQQIRRSNIKSFKQIVLFFLETPEGILIVRLGHSSRDWERLLE